MFAFALCSARAAHGERLNAAPRRGGLQAEYRPPFTSVLVALAPGDTRALRLGSGGATGARGAGLEVPLVLQEAGPQQGVKRKHAAAATN